MIKLMIEFDKSKLVFGTTTAGYAIHPWDGMAYGSPEREFFFWCRDKSLKSGNSSKNLRTHEESFVVGSNELNVFLGDNTLESLEKKIQDKTIYCISHNYLSNDQVEITYKVKSNLDGFSF